MDAEKPDLYELSALFQRQGELIEKMADGVQRSDSSPDALNLSSGEADISRLILLGMRFLSGQLAMTQMALISTNTGTLSPGVVKNLVSGRDQAEEMMHLLGTLADKVARKSK